MLPGFCSFFASMSHFFCSLNIFEPLWSFQPLWCLWRLVSWTWFEWGFCLNPRLLCAFVHFNSLLPKLFGSYDIRIYIKLSMNAGEILSELSIALSFYHIQSIHFRTPCQTVQHGTVNILRRIKLESQPMHLTVFHTTLRLQETCEKRPVTSCQR